MKTCYEVIIEVTEDHKHYPEAYTAGDAARAAVHYFQTQNPGKRVTAVGVNANHKYSHKLNTATVEVCPTCDGLAYHNDGTECCDCNGTGNDSTSGRR